jgi:hypothetical protein
MVQWLQSAMQRKRIFLLDDSYITCNKGTMGESASSHHLNHSTGQWTLNWTNICAVEVCITRLARNISDKWYSYPIVEFHKNMHIAICSSWPNIQTEMIASATKRCFWAISNREITRSWVALSQKGGHSWSTPQGSSQDLAGKEEGEVRLRPTTDDTAAPPKPHHIEPSIDRAARTRSLDERWWRQEACGRASTSGSGRCEQSISPDLGKVETEKQDDEVVD